MPLQEMQFGEGEQKLAAAFEQISTLWRMLFVLNTRIEIDSMVLVAVLDASEHPHALRETWQKLCSEWLPSKLLRDIGDQGLQEAKDEMNQRTQFWTEVINKIAKREE